MKSSQMIKEIRSGLNLNQSELADVLGVSQFEGRLFEHALTTGLDCPSFIESFMNSKTAAALDDVYDRLQWAGEEYILEELNDEVGGLKRADTRTMSECWRGFHTFDVTMAIDDLKEIYKQKCKERLC